MLAGSLAAGPSEPGGRGGLRAERDRAAGRGVRPEHEEAHTGDPE